MSGLKACPNCGRDAIFVPLIPAVGYDGKLYGTRSEGFCNNPNCDQLLWYYPRSGRVTRRNGGLTLSEYWLRHSNIDIFNSARRRAGLCPVIVNLDGEDSHPLIPILIRMDTEPRILSVWQVWRLKVRNGSERSRRALVDWYYWLRAAVLSPFRKDQES